MELEGAYLLRDIARSRDFLEVSLCQSYLGPHNHHSASLFSSALGSHVPREVNIWKCLQRLPENFC